MTRGVVGAIAAAVVIAGCGQGGQSGAEVASKPLRIAELRGAVVRMGLLRGEPLYGVRLRTLVCSRSRAEADRTLPISFRIAHYITRGRTARRWGRPFRVLDNDLYWLVTLGETTKTACRAIRFEDVIPPENYAGVESPLGVLGYSTIYRCYGVRLTLRALVGKSDNPIPASKRSTIQCGRFRPH